MKEEIIVHSQSEFDAIPKDFDGLIVIEKTIGVISVEARGNSSVVAWDNSSVVARGNSRVEARGNSSVVAWDNSSVEARGNSSVVARENSSGKAFDNSRILILDKSAKFKNYMNAVIQNYVEPKYTKDIFVELAEKEKGKLVLYKSVDPETLCDFYTGKIKYELGQTVECPDWDPDESRECGGGLHLSPTARKTQEFNKGKILKCLVDSEDIVVYSGSIEKVRCKKVFPVAIVDKRGNIISENNRNEVHKD